MVREDGEREKMRGSFCIGFEKKRRATAGKKENKHIFPVSLAFPFPRESILLPLSPRASVMNAYLCDKEDKKKGERRGPSAPRGRHHRTQRCAQPNSFSHRLVAGEKAKKGVGEFFPLRAEVRAQPTFFSSSSTPTSYFTSPLFFFFFFFFFLFLSEKGGGESSCTLHFTRRAPSWPFLDSSCKSRKAGSKGKKQFSSSSQSV